MSEARIILTTFPSEESARQIGTVFLERQLIACLTFLPAARSLYFWENKVHDEPECLALLKTSCAKLAEIEEIFHELHPYDLPEFVVLSPSQLSASYEKWLLASVR